MADLTELQFVGDWRVVIQSRDASWEQRVVIDAAEGGSHVVGGVGSTLDIYGVGQTPWTLRIQHNPGSGWAESWVKLGARAATDSAITQVVESEDTTTASSDRDFNDLIIRLEKLGMLALPSTPFAVWPATLQMMPEGIFEAALGRYLLAVRVENVWTQPWPAGAAVGLTTRCRQWLATAGVTVADNWSADDQAACGQRVVGGAVEVGALQPWQSSLIYFKVDVSGARVQKHNVEVEVVRPQAEDLGHLNKRSRGPISVSRTAYDTQKSVFTAESDRGTLTAAIKEIAVDYNTLRRAVTNARDLFRSTRGSGGSGGSGGSRCSPAEIEHLRERLRAFIDGKDVDICGIWRELECCCAGGDRGGDDGSWVGSGGGDISFFAFPTVVDYRVDYALPFAGQFGPIPYDDPFWKILLIIIAIILTIAAFISAAADLANRSDDTVIGTVTRTVLNALAASPATPPVSTDPGSVDAAVVTLNGSRSQTPAMFSFLDAAGDEVNTTPIVSAGGRIDTAGASLTNLQLDQIFQNLANNPADPTAGGAALLFKSGARTGVTLGVLAGLMPIASRSNGTTIFFLNQLLIVPDPMAPTPIGRPGDSGSLWLQRGTNAVVGLNHAGPDDPAGGVATSFAIANRIEDVLMTMGIRFA
jgi:hypothetical protein